MAEKINYDLGLVGLFLQFPEIIENLAWKVRVLYHALRLKLFPRNSLIAERSLDVLSRRLSNGKNIDFAVPQIINALKINIFSIKKKACMVIANVARHKIDITPAVPTLKEHLNYTKNYLIPSDYSREIIGYSIYALVSHYTAKEMWNEVRKLMENNDFLEVVVVGLVIAAKNRVNHAPLLPELASALNHKNKDIRIQASEAIMETARNGTDISSVVPALTVALKDEESRVRFYSSWALLEASKNGADISSSISGLVNLFFDEMGGTDHNAYLAVEQHANDLIRQNYDDKTDNINILSHIKDVTSIVMKAYKGKTNYYRVRDKKKLLSLLSDAALKIRNSMDEKKTFPVRKQDIKKQPKARRAILAS